jgi:transcription factor MYB, plant
MASRLPGRTDNDVKNYWNTKLKKRYLASSSTSTTQGRSPPPPSPPPAPAPPSGDNSSNAAAAADIHHTHQDEKPCLPPAPPALTELDTAFADDTLLFKSEQLYAELVGLIGKQSSSTGDRDEASTPSSSSSGTASCSPTPTVSSSGSCTLWPVDVRERDTAALLSEPTTALLNAYGAADDAFGQALSAYSFQDLLASSYVDL